MRFLADHALFGLQNEDWRYDPVFDSTRNVAVPLAILAAWRSINEDAHLPVRELFLAINELAMCRGIENNRWHEPITCAPRREAPLVVKETLLDPVTERFEPETQEAIQKFCKRFFGYSESA